MVYYETCSLKATQASHLRAAWADFCSGRQVSSSHSLKKGPKIPPNLGWKAPGQITCTKQFVRAECSGPQSVPF